MVLTNLLMLTGLSILVALPVAFFSDSIMGAYGADFLEGRSVLVLVCIYSVLWAANIVIGQILWSTGESMLAMILAAVRAAILLVSFFFVTPHNAYGMALAYTITYILQTLYQSIISALSIKKRLTLNHSSA
jgi:O-antigen/teichoic acid export membrane protein